MLSECHTATEALLMGVIWTATWSQGDIQTQARLAPKSHATNRAKPIWVTCAATQGHGVIQDSCQEPCLNLWP